MRRPIWSPDSKAFVSDIQVDISASLPIHMRFGRQTLFAGDRTRRGRNPAVFPAYQDRDPEAIRSGYRKEIIHTLFTAVFYLITELNQREQSSEQKQGRCEVLFDQFMQLLGEYNMRERNVSFYARQLTSPRNISRRW